MKKIIGFMLITISLVSTGFVKAQYREYNVNSDLTPTPATHYVYTVNSPTVGVTTLSSENDDAYVQVIGPNSGVTFGYIKASVSNILNFYGYGNDGYVIAKFRSNESHSSNIYIGKVISNGLI